MALRVLRCAIEEVAQWHPELFLEPHIVGCVAVLSQYSDSPAVGEGLTWPNRRRSLTPSTLWT
jgi:hypothetical protein